MLKSKRLAVFTIWITAMVFCGWDVLFNENEPVRLLGIRIVNMLGTAISFYWLLQAYQSSTGKRKNFWRLVTIGMLLYLVSNSIWVYVEVSRNSLADGISYAIMLLAYLFFFASLVYKTKVLSAGFSSHSFFFNLAVYMITATAISLHYLITPMLQFADNSLMNSLLAAAYPIADLGMFFIALILYYFIQPDKERDVLMLFLSGFLLQAATDSVYAYTSMTGSYYEGNILDLFWLIAMLLIGFSGYYAQGYKGESELGRANAARSKEFILPYASILVLIVLVIITYHWDFNALSFGLLIAILIVLGRQLFILRENNQLMVQYRDLAYHDPLTGLKNRMSFMEAMEDFLEKPDGGKTALLLMDLDRFKAVNDTMGHYVGDHILIKTAERLKESLAETASIFRLGGDEFVVILPEATEQNCTSATEGILAKFQKPFLVEDYEVSITPSIGISIYPEHGTTGEDLFKHADAAMYTAKESAKNNFKFYDTELNKTMARKMKIESGLKKAIEKNEFTLVYQPKVDLQKNELIGMEALLRWQHPELGWISPLEFIPVAEEAGQIVPIGQWVLETACVQNMAWQNQGFSPLCVSVNVSVLQFEHGEFLKTVRKALEESGLSPQCLELEITESIMQNTKESVEILSGLREIGVKTSIDDFGTGYSSLHILQTLPIDTLKIDKSFIDNVDKPKQQAMVKTIIDFGQTLDLSIVAEGIETEEQRNVLKRINCHIGQGYLFSKPVSPKEFEAILAAHGLIGEGILSSV
ncbi:putative bifunctional diguanylate cyclase/phosphodiesterase [Planococcus sp. YIM B11945]|uniref:putative bifunctional diguanylate cyclase/phosphodiesterase n=1 Tax=Planococcus sp. YIM B11945 TaxID=3435410 RepID=UPI003D7C4119